MLARTVVFQSTAIFHHRDHDDRHDRFSGRTGIDVCRSRRKRSIGNKDPFVQSGFVVVVSLENGGAPGFGEIGRHADSAYLEFVITVLY